MTSFNRVHFSRVYSRFLTVRKTGELGDEPDDGYNDYGDDYAEERPAKHDYDHDDEYNSTTHYNDDVNERSPVHDETDRSARVDTDAVGSGQRLKKSLADRLGPRVVDDTDADAAPVQSKSVFSRISRLGSKVDVYEASDDVASDQDSPEYDAVQVSAPRRVSTSGEGRVHVQEMFCARCGSQEHYEDDCSKRKREVVGVDSYAPRDRHKKHKKNKSKKHKKHRGEKKSSKRDKH